MKRFMLAALLITSYSAETMADDNRTHALNFCPLGVPVYNLYAVNFEYFMTPQHGFDLRLDYAPLSDNDIDITDKAMIINYRWYVNKSFNSIFAGAYTRYRINSGSGTASGTRFDYDSKELTLGLNIGKRWLWKNGFNVVVLAGYGFSHFEETVKHGNEAVDSAVDTFKDDNSLFFDNPFYGEFSIGYAF